jgi:hypothetical protein
MFGPFPCNFMRFYREAHTVIFFLYACPLFIPIDAISCMETIFLHKFMIVNHFPTYFVFLGLQNRVKDLFFIMVLSLLYVLPIDNSFFSFYNERKKGKGKIASIGFHAFFHF